MTKDINSQQEFALQTMFGREIPPVADAGFSKTVLGRVRRRIWKRRVILLSATAIGLLIALPTATQLLLVLSNELVALVASAEESEALGQFQVLLSMLPLRETAQAASEELRAVSSQVNAASWFQQNQMLVVAGLMALVSFVTTRLLND